MTGLEFIYNQFEKSLYGHLVRVIKGDIYVYLDNIGEGLVLYVDISNGDLRWAKTYKNVQALLEVDNSRSIANTVIEDYKSAVDQQFFKKGKFKWKKGS